MVKERIRDKALRNAQTAHERMATIMDRREEYDRACEERNPKEKDMLERLREAAFDLIDDVGDDALAYLINSGVQMAHGLAGRDEARERLRHEFAKAFAPAVAGVWGDDLHTVDAFGKIGRLCYDLADAAVKAGEVIHAD